MPHGWREVRPRQLKAAEHWSESVPGLWPQGTGRESTPSAPSRDYKSEFDMDSHRQSEVRGGELSEREYG